MTSKRKLSELVERKAMVAGLGRPTPADPLRACAAAASRRPRSCDFWPSASGSAKANSTVDVALLDALRCGRIWKARWSARDALRASEPLKLVTRPTIPKCSAASRIASPARHQLYPHDVPKEGQPQAARSGRTLFIERDDFAEVPPKGFFRLFPGNKVRLKYGMVVECTGCEKDASGRVTAVLATVVPDTKSGTPGADAVKVKGTITWVGAHETAVAARPKSPTRDGERLRTGGISPPARAPEGAHPRDRASATRVETRV